ncbi:MAG: glycosyl hydrolase family 30 [Tannerella sp.]|jgi:glucosylceramidase|nr:glycosyl hydrolase family 30 [Tannerella sp.]
MKSPILFSALVLLFFSVCNAQKASWVSSIENDLWKQQKNIQPKTKAPAGTVVEIDLSNPQQDIEGFGGCFNELSWDALQLVDEQMRDKILNDLFNPNDGLKFNFCRTPIGANDYSRGWYSYDETDGDFELKYFSIERDKEAIIPYIKAALKINPNIKIWASPWSAPTWFKINHHYANKSTNCNDLPKSREVPNYQDQMIQDSRYLQAYALYFSKYLDAYKAEGIAISRVMYQNEAFTFADWPNCSWSPHSIGRFNAEYLGSKLAETHPEVEIYAGTFNTRDMKVFETIMSYPNFTKYVKGLGLQWEGRDAVAKIHERYPETKLMQTESECGNGKFSWKDAEHTFDLMKRYFNGGVSSYMNWNMVLKDDGASAWCWKQNALIRILSSTKEVIYTPEYYVYKHISSFVPKGSVKLPVKQVNESYDNILAFKTPENSIIAVLANYMEEPEEITLKVNKKYLTVTLPAKSFNTVKISN